ncbi:MAG: phosphatase PAP2 family protein [Candidatus Saccharimonadales bacterium]
MDGIIVFCARYLFIFVVLGLALAWLPLSKKAKIQFIVATILAGIVAFILSRIGGHFYVDQRPFVAQHVKPLLAHAADNGFPSDHALLTGTLTAITYFFNKKIANIMLVLTIIIGIARVLARVHSPLDIAGGWVFGVIGALAGYYLMRWIFNKYFARKIS